MIAKTVAAICLSTLPCLCSMAAPGEGDEIEKGRVIKTLNITDSSMSDVCRMLSESCARPIVVSSKAAATKISIFIQNIRCMDALDAICRTHGLWYRLVEDSGIYHVQTLDEIKDNLKIYNDEAVESVTILYPSAVDVGEAIQELFMERVIWMPPDEESGDEFNKIQRALDRMDLIHNRAMFDFMEENSSDGNNGDGQNSSSTTIGSSNSSGERTMRTRSDSGDSRKEAGQSSGDKGKKLDGLLTRKDIQALIQQEKLSNLYKLTGQPGIVYISALPGSNTLLLRSEDPTSLGQIKELIAKLDKPSPQVLLEVKVLLVSLDDTNARGLDFLFDTGTTGNATGGFANGLMTMPQGGQLILPNTETLVPAGSGVDSQAAILNVISDHVKFRLQMLENQGRISRLATPNLLVADNEASRIFVGTETTVLEKAESTTTYIPGAADEGYIPTTNWDIEAPRRNIGVSLLITPRIHADKSVTIRLLQERSKLGQQQTNTYSGGTTDAGDDALAQASETRYFISQDIDQQSLTTTVHAMDGNTVVIGGLIDEDLERKANVLPVLGHLPLIGDLFNRDKETRTRAEILVVIRPFVLTTPQEAKDSTQEFLKRMSQHPSAHGDIPAMGVTYDWELAKPFHYNPSDPLLKRMKNKLRAWSVDTRTPADVLDAVNEGNVKSKKSESEQRRQEIKEYFDEDRSSLFWNALENNN